MARAVKSFWKIALPWHDQDKAEAANRQTLALVSRAEAARKAYIEATMHMLKP